MNQSKTNFKRLLMVSLDWTRAKDPRVPLGHGSILAAVRRDSPHVQVSSLHHHVNYFNFKDARQELQHYINVTQDHDYSCIGFGVYVWNDRIAKQLMKEARTMGYKGTVVVGGPQISYSGKGDNLETLYPDADAFVRGYGEDVMVQLLNSSPSFKIKIHGLHWRGQDDLVSQAEPSLNDLPSPYLLHSNKSLVPLSPFIRWETQRGCPFKCSFCQHREAGQLKRRHLETTRIEEEIDLFCKHKIEDIAVLDPTFNSGNQYKSVLSRFIAHGFRGKLSLQCRFEMADSDFLDLCSKLNVKLEFGLQTIHKIEQEAINRPNNMKKVAHILQELNLRQIHYEVSIIFGLPQQTLESFKETVNYCLQNKVPVLKAFPLMLLRGTAMQKNKDLYGLVENSEVIPAVVSSNTFNERDWKQMEEISKLLQNTEGNHPNTVKELLDNNSPCVEMCREPLWSPII